MSKLLKFLSCVICICLSCGSYAMADQIPGHFETIPIDITIDTVVSLDVTVRNIVVPNAEAPLSFSAVGVVDPADAWRVSDQYLDIAFSANTASWGVRIITDNRAAWPAMAAFKTGPGEADPGPYDWNDWNNGDEILSYGGIINTAPAHLPNPNMRAAMGWQVYDAVVAKPANPTDASFGGNPYSSTWAYLSDVSNNVALANGTRELKADGTPLLAGEQGVVTGTTAGGEQIFNYALVAFGGVGQGLAQHPAGPDADGDGNPDARPCVSPMAVYLAARFANTDYSGLAPRDFVLPGGSYSARLFVEVIHE